MPALLPSSCAQPDGALFPLRCSDPERENLLQATECVGCCWTGFTYSRPAGTFCDPVNGVDAFTNNTDICENRETDFATYYLSYAGVWQPRVSTESNWRIQPTILATSSSTGFLLLDDDVWMPAFAPWCFSFPLVGRTAVPVSNSIIRNPFAFRVVYTAPTPSQHAAHSATLSACVTSITAEPIVVEANGTMLGLVGQTFDLPQSFVMREVNGIEQPCDGTPVCARTDWTVPLGKLVNLSGRTLQIRIVGNQPQWRPRNVVTPGFIQTRNRIGLRFRPVQGSTAVLSEVFDPFLLMANTNPQCVAVPYDHTFSVTIPTDPCVLEFVTLRQWSPTLQYVIADARIL